MLLSLGTSIMENNQKVNVMQCSLQDFSVFSKNELANVYFSPLRDGRTDACIWKIDLPNNRSEVDSNLHGTSKELQIKFCTYIIWGFCQWVRILFVEFLWESSNSEADRFKQSVYASFDTSIFHCWEDDRVVVGAHWSDWFWEESQANSIGSISIREHQVWNCSLVSLK